MAEDLFVFGPSDIVKRPHNTFPWSDHANFNNYMWVQMKARKISDQNTSGRGGTIAGGQQLLRHGAIAMLDLFVTIQTVKMSL